MASRLLVAEFSICSCKRASCIHGNEPRPATTEEVTRAFLAQAEAGGAPAKVALRIKGAVVGQTGSAIVAVDVLEILGLSALLEEPGKEGEE